MRRSSLPSAFAGTLNFNIKRGGILYGSVEEGGKVKVDFIYEPPQEANATTLTLQRWVLGLCNFHHAMRAKMASSLSLAPSTLVLLLGLNMCFP